MALFRSDEMKLCQMLLHKESAFDCLAELGHLGAVQFLNLHSADHQPNMKYINEVQRCTEMQRIVTHLQTEIDDCGDIEVTYYPDIEDETPQAKDVKIIEQTLQDLYTELSDVEKNYEVLLEKKNLQQEKKFVLEKASEFLHGEHNTESLMAWSDSVVQMLMHDETHKETESSAPTKSTRQATTAQPVHHHHHDQMQLGFFVGSIPAERFHSFELLLWRLSHGNCYMRHTEIAVPTEDLKRNERMVRKFAFILVFQGNSLRNKVAKLCQGYRVNLFECPESREERAEARIKIDKDLSDMQMVLKQTNTHRRYMLTIAAADLFIWKLRIKKTLMVYHVLNRLAAVEGVQNQQYLQAECWIPAVDVSAVRKALTRGAKRASKGEAGMLFPPMLTEKYFDPNRTDMKPPTFFRLNRFTRGFQNLIDAYGIASYQEVNPTPFTIITFPFLFSVMFGDIGHGIIMAFFAYWMVDNEAELERKAKMKTKKNEIFELLFGGRYVILLMGLFSIYAGFLYNDIFSKCTNLFGSKWHISFMDFQIGLGDRPYIELDPADMDYYDGVPYVFGLDPVVHAQGEYAIIFLNSLKMKLAIIFGITQMVFGLGIAAWNHCYFKNYIDLLLVCLPQTIFLLSMFGYLAVLVIIKWWRYGGHHVHPRTSECAPSILITFINMILFKGPVPVPPECENHIYRGQQGFQIFLVIVAALCVPVLLVGKPLAFLVQNRRIQKIIDEEIQERQLHKTLSVLRKSLMYRADDPEEPRRPISYYDELLVDLSEVWVHQGIHCIESILGAVSHTASYLRLWALSLAHDQLSHVLWTMVLSKPLTWSLSYTNSIFIYMAFAVWGALTLAILVVMEGLSAFLHTLRLHWVEFQTKFYDGQGEAFLPFRFDKN